MNPTKLVQDLIQNSLSSEVLKDYKFSLVSYNRKDPSKGLSPVHYEVNERVIMDLDADSKDWDSWVEIHRILSNKNEAGYINVIRFENMQNHMKNFYIPIIDFAPIVDIEQCDFSVLKQFGNNKLHIFNSGNSYHGVLNKLMSPFEYIKWVSVLAELPFVDQKWIAYSANNRYKDHSQVLRTTNSLSLGGIRRPEPTYLKDIDL